MWRKATGTALCPHCGGGGGVARAGTGEPAAGGSGKRDGCDGSFCCDPSVSTSVTEIKVTHDLGFTEEHRGSVKTA